MRWILCCMFLACILYAQTPNTQLEELKQTLDEIQGQIQDLEKQAVNDSSPELQEELQQLREQAKELESDIQALLNGKEPIPPPRGEQPFEPGMPTPPPPGERPFDMGNPIPPPRGEQPFEPGMPTPNFMPQNPNQPMQMGPKNQGNQSPFAELERQLQQKRQKLEKLKREFKQANKEDQGYLQIEMKKAQEEVRILEKKIKEAHKNQNRQSAPSHGNRPMLGPNRPGMQEKNIEAELKEFTKQLQKESPEEYQKLLQVQKRNPQEFRHHLHRLFRENQELERMKKQDPTQYELLKQQKMLQKQLDQLALILREMPREERATKAEELRKILSSLFDVRLGLEQHKIEMMQKRIEYEQQVLQKRQTNKQIIVEQKLQEMLGERSEWDW